MAVIAPRLVGNTLNSTKADFGPYVRVEVVTPERAAKLLKLNTHNRDLNLRKKQALAGAIARGEWRLNGDCIVLSGTGDDHGELYNGQHRLYAIVDAGVSVRVAIMYNADIESQETMDSGMKRSFGAKLKLRGEKYCTELGSAIKLAWRYETAGTIEDRYHGGTSDQQFFDYLSKNPGLRDVAPLGMALRNEFLSPAGSWPGYVFLFRKYAGEALANSFFEQLVSGADLDAQSPVYLLRSLLLKQRATPKGRRLGDTPMGAALIKAFNAYCLGQRPKLLKFDIEREEFPQIVTREELQA